MTIEFKEFSKIAHIGKLYMNITEKLHGSNAQIYIFQNEQGELDLIAGSRQHWISPVSDNYGFAQFCHERKDELIAKLGVGRHFGEWCGSGINGGIGLKVKKLALFNWQRWRQGSIPEEALSLPDGVTTVPLIYSGAIYMEQIELAMKDLKDNGSRFSPGFMKPEGIVIEIGGKFYKKVFDPEETAWAGIKKEPNLNPIVRPDVSHLLQPIRLEKLLSRDEAYLRDYPTNIATICSEYVKDLDAEGQITGNEEEVKLMKKSLGKYVFPFIKSIVAEMQKNIYHEKYPNIIINEG